MTPLRSQATGKVAVALLAVSLLSIVFLTGCRRKNAVEIETNLAPNTRLTSAPAPPNPISGIDQHNYRVHLYWEGSDADGYVVAYYFAWDDTLPSPGAPNSAWTYTTRTDSLFKAVISGDTETMFHTFYVRSVDNEGALDPSPANIFFEAWTAGGVVDSLYRLHGPDDPNDLETYNPGYKDTVLMGTPCEFVWNGHDPDGLGAPVTFSYKLDSNPFSPFTDATRATLTDIRSGTHLFWVRTLDETGFQSFPESYKFVMNYDPDSHIRAPADSFATETLTWPDKTPITFTWSARDREEVLQLPDAQGVVEIWIELDSGFQKEFEFALEETVYEGEWYFTSNTYPASENYIASTNIHVGAGGGNRPHEFRIFAKDDKDRFETPSPVPDDREIYRFWYNFPPTTEITYPTEGDTVCPDFVVQWVGEDVDGGITAYQYVLDPSENSFRETSETEMGYTDIAPGPHQFWVAARDSSECWQKGYKKVNFWVEECE